MCIHLRPLERLFVLDSKGNQYFRSAWTWMTSSKEMRYISITTSCSPEDTPLELLDRHMDTVGKHATSTTKTQPVRGK